MSQATAETVAFLLAMGINIASIAFGVRRAYRHIAYMTRHRPIWQAWADCMGSIKVRASFVRDEIDGEAP